MAKNAEVERRAKALTAAVQLYGELKGRQEKYNWDDIANDTMYLADKFYAYIMDFEEELEVKESETDEHIS